MYVRTEYGIAKVIDVEYKSIGFIRLDRRIMIDHLEDYMDCCTAKDIIGEPSFEIIDVIEQGDLVNDIFVESNNGVVLETLEIDYEWSTLGHARYVEISKDKIETVITKEQLAAMAYTIK